jgi:hypothetical protein
MDVIIVVAVLTLALFLLSMVHGRRFGLLGLALAAGSILSGIWSYDVGLIMSGVGVAYTPLSKAVIETCIALLPAGILLFHGDKYKTLLGRLTGSALFSFLAIAFLVPSMGYVLMPQGIGADIYGWLVDNRSAVIGLGMMLAVGDLFLTKPTYSRGKSRKH